jgi:serine/threonine protein kinase
MAQGEAPVRVGRFLLFKSLKKGGMARVFLGLDPAAPERLVAVKTLLPKLAQDRLYREMFATEGKVGVRLVHPHIVRTLEHGADGGTAFIAMDFICGYDLAAVLRRLRKQGRPMPLPLALGVARDVCDALSYAHELTDELGQPLDIVNRDVSPGNIMVAFDGQVQLIDFGIAQTTMDVRSQIGSIKGKISYMSPEQVRGLPVDQRSDVFAVATVLYEMLTGVHVFHAEGDFATMEKVRRAEAPPPSSHNPAIDAELDAIVARAMSREMADRHPRARDLLADLRGYMARHGMEVTAPDVARFMSSLFGSQITELTEEIEKSRVDALRFDGRDTTPGAPVEPPMLGTNPDEPPKPPPPPVAPPPVAEAAPRRVPWAIVAAAAAALAVGALFWLR